MTVEGGKRRQAIMSAATNLFLKMGFERVTMSEIAACVGGSKTTLYSHFDSKEKLFAAVILDAIDGQTRLLVEMLNPSSQDLRQGLERFGTAYLSFLLCPIARSIMRTAIAEGEKSGLGRILYERGPEQSWQPVIAFIAEAIHDGQLRDADPVSAALHLKGLFQAGWFELYMFGGQPMVDRKEIVQKAVDVFLRAYSEPSQRTDHADDTRMQSDTDSLNN
jgi:AcrR family transcriptional regulator